VAIYSRDGLYWLRWSYQGKRYGLAVGHGQIKPTRALAAKIETDMAAGHFDVSLEAYKPKVDQKLDQTRDPVLSTGELWQMYMEVKRPDVSGQRIAAVYEPILANLRRYGRDIADLESAQGFINLLRSRQSVLIANQNLTLLKSFGAWCVKQGHWQVNHFADIPPAKGGIRPRKNPFTVDEVHRFLATIKTDADYWHY
ncbi:MAG: hypothetical protein NZL92_12325, partial [Gloeomargarita sp. SKYG116]|nr:hypothetical protein [Gloeomargarita sp. SKYG116]MDW8402466.1 hypothetical protein [Gloeomargarita sp. SKYGB_i_bin116]